jgi:hypothetical protein
MGNKFCLSCEKWFRPEDMITENFCSPACLKWDHEHFPEMTEAAQRAEMPPFVAAIFGDIEE